MRKVVVIMTAIGLTLALGTFVAAAQTSVTLMDSGSGQVMFTGDGAGELSTKLGTCGRNGCAISGTAGGSLNGLAVSNYTISSPGPISLDTSHSGTFSADAEPLEASKFTVTGAGGSVLFTGTLTSLSFTQAGSSNDGQVTMRATAVGPDGVSISLSGMTALGEDANINAIATSDDSAGGGIAVVPEPATIFLFGSGLIAMGGALRRRRRA